MQDWDTRLASKERNSFDAIRLALATMVLLEHAYFLPANGYQHEPLYLFSGGQTDFGSVGVDGFFVLSGFLITRSWLETGSALRYFQRRIARIAPGFFVAVAASIAIGAWASGDAHRFLAELNWKVLAAQTVTLHAPGLSSFPDNPMHVVDGTLWTIRPEFDCYLMVALLGATGLLTRGIVALLLGCGVVIYALQNSGVIAIPHVDYGYLALLISSPHYWPRLFTFFLAGAGFYLWRASIPKSGMLFAVAVAVLLGSLRLGGAEAALVIAGPYILFWIALSSEMTVTIAGRRVDLSYGIYLFGFPLQQAVIAVAGTAIHPLALFAVSFALSCGTAYLSWTFIEAPALRARWPLRKRAIQAP